jgi:hypothetical protein
VIARKMTYFLLKCPVMNCCSSNKPVTNRRRMCHPGRSGQDFSSGARVWPTKAAPGRGGGLRYRCRHQQATLPK